jgi:hypothetical protein
LVTPPQFYGLAAFSACVDLFRLGGPKDLHHRGWLIFFQLLAIVAKVAGSLFAWSLHKSSAAAGGARALRKRGWLWPAIAPSCLLLPPRLLPAPPLLLPPPPLLLLPPQFLADLQCPSYPTNCCVGAATGSAGGAGGYSGGFRAGASGAAAVAPPPTSYARVDDPFASHAPPVTPPLAQQQQQHQAAYVPTTLPQQPPPPPPPPPQQQQQQQQPPPLPVAVPTGPPPELL